MNNEEFNCNEDYLRTAEQVVYSEIDLYKHHLSFLERMDVGDYHYTLVREQQRNNIAQICEGYGLEATKFLDYHAGKVQEEEK